MDRSGLERCGWSRQARSVQVRLGVVCLVGVRRGMAGMVSPGQVVMVRLGVARLVTAGTVRQGSVRSGQPGLGMAGKVRQG